jgi:hypothetical protein
MSGRSRFNILNGIERCADASARDNSGWRLSLLHCDKILNVPAGCLIPC